MSQTLRACISEIEIELQKQPPETLLKKLQHDKSHAQRQLNEMSDPIARLPVEISSEIFLQTTTVPFPDTVADRAPILLLRVCNTWTAIAVSTPALWTSVKIHLPCSKSFRKWILPAWLDRARDYPLSVSFGGDLRYWNYRVSTMIWQHAGQLKHLEIMNEEVKDADEELFLLDIFGEASPSCMPLLESLVIRNLVWRRAFSGHQIFDLLRRMPNIIKFRTEPRYFLPIEEASIVVPSLRQVWFGNDEAWYDEILDHLTLPALETLAVSMTSSGDLLRFMMRSAPPLQNLEICWTWNSEHSSIDLLGCLRLTPTLTRFQMVGSNLSVIQDLFTALADCPSLLPQICNLMVHPEYNDDGAVAIFEASWRMLVRALFARRVQLRLVAVQDVKVPTAPDVLAALSELPVQIYIGTEESHFTTTAFPMEVLHYGRWWD
ncbi:hypothetical protein C8R45DRAFT_955217 [Mycena sanguinolenta]|nr:hypothetical protein C8R45DRAFT_955217 [Mycena sanguinolenta]